MTNAVEDSVRIRRRVVLMPWRVLALSSTVDLPDGTPQAIDADAGLCVFTTADLRWQPLVSGDPDGAQIATLWGDPVDGAFGAVLRVKKNSGDVYTLLRRRDADEPRHAFEALHVSDASGKFR